MSLVRMLVLAQAGNEAMVRKKPLKRCAPHLASAATAKPTSIARAALARASSFAVSWPQAGALQVALPAGSSARAEAAVSLPAGSPASAQAAVLLPAGSSAVAASEVTMAEIIRFFERSCHRSGSDFLTALGLPRSCSARSKDGAAPRRVIQALTAAREPGVDIVKLADGVVERRFIYRISESSTTTYASHLGMISLACEVFGCAPLGCSVIDVRRVAAICVCASTQRGWLSAWAMAHQVAGVPWQGDRDIILRGLRIGTLKSRVPRFPRKRVDRKLARALLKRAITGGMSWWSVILVLAYNFLLRMPSELFGQYKRSFLRESGGRFSYGPIRRKQRLDWCTITAFCTCRTDPAMCLHAWCSVTDELDAVPNSKHLGGYTPTSWTARLRQLLAAEGLPDPEEWYGNDVQRGAAADAFAAEGVDSMLSRGGWRNLSGARPDVPADEILAGYLAQNVIDDSALEN